MLLRHQKPAQLTVPFLFLEQKLATSQSVWDGIIFSLTLEVKHAGNIFPPAFPIPTAFGTRQEPGASLHRQETAEATQHLQCLALARNGAHLSSPEPCRSGVGQKPGGSVLQSCLANSGRLASRESSAQIRTGELLPVKDTTCCMQASVCWNAGFALSEPANSLW